MAIINGQPAVDIANLIDEPQQAKRTFRTTKAFHGYIRDAYQIECRKEQQIYSIWTMLHSIDENQPSGTADYQNICYPIRQISIPSKESGLQ